jgi:uncharacterized protein YjeT (DUF2065 family)
MAAERLPRDRGRAGVGSLVAAISPAADQSLRRDPGQLDALSQQTLRSVGIATFALGVAPPWPQIAASGRK